MSDPNQDASSVYTLETNPVVLSPPKVVFLSNRKQCHFGGVTQNCVPDGTYRWGFNDVPLSILQEAQEQLDTLALNTATSAFSQFQNNPSPITINDNAVASPYPSGVVIAGMAGVIESVTVILHGFAHTHPSDVWIGLSQDGVFIANTLLMAACGGSNSISGVDIIFDDTAAQNLPQSTIASGSYLCTNHLGFNPINPFPAPAPQTGMFSSDLSAFVGKPPNAHWSLWVRDVLAGDTGSISGGWSLFIETH